MNTKDKIKDRKNLEEILEFSNLDESHELFTNKNEKLIDKLKLETPKDISIDEFVALRSNAYSFICNCGKANKIEGISKSYSKIFKFEEYKKGLDGEKYQKNVITIF